MSKVNNVNKIIEAMYWLDESKLPEGFTGALKLFGTELAVSKKTGNTYRKRELREVRKYKDGKLHCEDGPAVFYGKDYLKRIQEKIDYDNQHYTREEMIMHYYPGSPPYMPKSEYWVDGVKIHPLPR